MSKRLQVVVDDEELARFEHAARGAGMTLSAWVRQTLRRAERLVAVGGQAPKLSALKAAASFAETSDVPAPPIGEMLVEIEAGRSGPGHP